MRIRWGNIFGLLALIVSIYVFLKLAPALDTLFDEAGPVRYHDPDPFHRAVLLGILCITVVAVCKIMCNRRR